MVASVANPKSHQPLPTSVSIYTNFLRTFAKLVLSFKLQILPTNKNAYRARLIMAGGFRICHTEGGLPNQVAVSASTGPTVTSCEQLLAELATYPLPMESVSMDTLLAREGGGGGGRD